ncbi:MAG: sulfite exporter TauE/SafE family protein [Polyangiaceae bacterium]|nr:sulfite exporter TauE/SafE family protein [Polyangiaceae bacterium]
MSTLVAPALLAILVGVALGLLGGGGSILTVPILVYAARLPAHEAIATSLFVVGTTSVAALVPHARAGRVRYGTGALFGAASMVGAFGAGKVARYVPAGVLLVAFGVTMAVTAGAMLRKKSEDEEHRAHRQALWKILLEGLVVGAVTGLVGAGGGFLVVPALVLLGGLPMRDAVGTSLLVIAMKSFAGFAGYLSSVPIDWTLAVIVAGTAVLGSFGGAVLAGRIPQAGLRKGFAWFVVGMAVFILIQEIPKLLGIPFGEPRFWALASLIALPALVGAGLAIRGVARGKQARAHALARSATNG